MLVVPDLLGDRPVGNDEESKYTSASMRVADRSRLCRSASDALVGV